MPFCTTLPRAPRYAHACQTLFVGPSLRCDWSIRNGAELSGSVYYCWCRGFMNSYNSGIESLKWKEMKLEWRAESTHKQSRDDKLDKRGRGKSIILTRSRHRVHLVRDTTSLQNLGFGYALTCRYCSSLQVKKVVEQLEEHPELLYHVSIDPIHQKLFHLCSTSTHYSWNIINSDMTSTFLAFSFPGKIKEFCPFCCSTSMPCSTNIPTLARTSRLSKWSSMPSLTGINSCPSYGIANTVPWKLRWKSVNRGGSSQKWSSCWVSLISLH